MIKKQWIVQDLYNKYLELKVEMKDITNKIEAHKKYGSYIEKSEKIIE